jgi:hypothetical protein
LFGVFAWDTGIGVRFGVRGKLKGNQMKGLDPFYNARLLDAKRSIERALVQDQLDDYFYDCVKRAITFLTEIIPTKEEGTFSPLSNDEAVALLCRLQKEKNHVHKN